jgi:phosphatidylserine/phosphatidylglycerophosphate/cardiolipin synthase-like enzyme
MNGPTSGEDPVTKWTNALGPGSVRPGNKVTALIDEEILPEMFEAIKDTEGPAGYIYLLSWQLDVKTPASMGGPPLEDLLKEAAKRRVQIRAMIWKDPKGVKYSEQSVEVINGLKTGVAIFDDHTWSIAASHHQKVLVVKTRRGLVAFCGGSDITGNVIKKPPGNLTNFHDVSCRIQGPSAYDLLGVFLQRWRAHPDTAKHGMLNGDVEAPPAPQGEQYVRIARTFNYMGSKRRTSVLDPSSLNPHGQGACKANRSVADTLIAAISKAQRFIYIEDQYMTHKVVADLLAAKIPNLQHLTILIPHELISDWPIIDKWRVPFVNSLNSAEGAKDRVRIFVRISHENPPLGLHTYVHSKTWIVDDELAVIGSANLDWRGWSGDNQANACIFDTPASVRKPSFAQQLRMRLWAEHLGISDQMQVADGIASKDLWREGKLPPKAAVLRWHTPLPPGPKPDPGVHPILSGLVALALMSRDALAAEFLLNLNAEFLKTCDQASYPPDRHAPGDATD